MSSHEEDARSHSGSSRSRDDYSRSQRNHKDKHRHDERGRQRSEDKSRTHERQRSRSPNLSLHRGIDDEQQRTRYNQEEEAVAPAPPPPPRISKITMGFNKPTVAPIKMSLGGMGGAVPSSAKSVGVARKVASVFNESDDDEAEEMPAEAKMRMRNIGRETPTSTGPNSFGKTKQGFCDAKKVFEKNLKQAMEQADPTAKSKLPQTIYKINPL